MLGLEYLSWWVSSPCVSESSASLNRGGESGSVCGLNNEKILLDCDFLWRKGQIIECNGLI